MTRLGRLCEPPCARGETLAVPCGPPTAPCGTPNAGVEVGIAPGSGIIPGEVCTSFGSYPAGTIPGWNCCGDIQGCCMPG